MTKIDAPSTKAFPDELLTTILAYDAPNPAAMATLKTVDRQFYRVLRQDTFWRLFSPQVLAASGESLHDAFERRKEHRTPKGNNIIFRIYDEAAERPADFRRQRTPELYEGMHYNSKFLLKTSADRDDDYEAAAVYAGPNLNEDAGFVIRQDIYIAAHALQTSERSVYQFLPTFLARQPAWIKMAVTADYRALMFMPQTTIQKLAWEFVADVVRQRPHAIEYVPAGYFASEPKRAVALYRELACQNIGHALYLFYEKLPEAAQEDPAIANLYLRTFYQHNVYTRHPGGRIAKDLFGNDRTFFEDLIRHNYKNWMLVHQAPFQQWLEDPTMKLFYAEQAFVQSYNKKKKVGI